MPDGNVSSHFSLVTLSGTSLLLKSIWEVIHRRWASWDLEKCYCEIEMIFLPATENEFITCSSERRHPAKLYRSTFFSQDGFRNHVNTCQLTSKDRRAWEAGCLELRILLSEFTEYYFQNLPNIIFRYFEYYFQNLLWIYYSEILLSKGRTEIRFGLTILYIRSLYFGASMYTISNNIAVCKDVYKIIRNIIYDFKSHLSKVNGNIVLLIGRRNKVEENRWKSIWRNHATLQWVIDYFVVSCWIKSN